MPGTQEWRRQRRSAGFIVVAVLWILSGFATLALIYSAYLGDSAISLSLSDDKVAAEAAISAGVEFTAYRLLATGQDRPTRGSFNVRLAGANVEVDFVSEAARIDLNAAPKDLLSGLFAVLGTRAQDAEQYADRVIGWRTLPKTGAQDAEGPYALGLSYSPRGAPFAHASELWLVAGLPPALVERAMSFVTVFSGRADVEISDAAPEVIAALPPAPSQSVFPSRGPDTGAQSASAANAKAQPRIGTTQGGGAFRMQVHVAFDNGRSASSEIVILLDGENEPYHVLAWRDEVPK